MVRLSVLFKTERMNLDLLTEYESQFLIKTDITNLVFWKPDICIRISFLKLKNRILKSWFQLKKEIQIIAFFRKSIFTFSILYASHFG